MLKFAHLSIIFRGVAFLLVVSARGEIRNLAVTTAGGYVPGITTDGGLSVAFCTGLTGINGILVADHFPLPLELGGVSIKVSGVPAPILAVASVGGYNQVNFQVPHYPSAPITVEISQGANSARLSVGSPYTPSVVGWPMDFFRDSNGYGAFQHADYTAVTARSPARRGDIIIAYGTGGGAVSPPVAPGDPAPASPLSVLERLQQEFPPAILINGPDATPAYPTSYTEVLYAGLTPGLAGVYQINFRVPEAAPSGDASVIFERAYCASPFGMRCGRLTPVWSGSVKIRVQ